jgi:carbohydrate-selective porin OprB
MSPGIGSSRSRESQFASAEALVGDLQGFNNVDSDRFRQLSEVWLEQCLFGDRLRVKLGKADANADFARVVASGGASPPTPIRR